MRSYPVLLAVTVVVLVLTCGCTLENPAVSRPVGNTTPAGNASVNLTPLLSGMLITLADLPEGYSADREGPTLPPSRVPATLAAGYVGGYTWSAMSYDGNETVSQTILVYSETEKPGDLGTFFQHSHPEISNWTLTPLNNPGLADRSVGYGFSPPGAGPEDYPLSKGYVFLFSKGGVHEIVKVTGPGYNETAGYSLARLAASRAGRV